MNEDADGTRNFLKETLTDKSDQRIDDLDLGLEIGENQVEYFLLYKNSFRFLKGNATSTHRPRGSRVQTYWSRV